MDQDLKKLEKGFPKKHKISFIPKYKSSFYTTSSQFGFMVLANETIEKLGWNMLFNNTSGVVAERVRSNFIGARNSEKLSMEYKGGKVYIESESTGSEIWDNGKNSKTVQLFIHVFQDLEKNYDREQLKQKEKELEAKFNWDDYEIPDQLPPPGPAQSPSIFWPIALSALATLIFAIVIAQIKINSTYIIFLFEILMGLGFAYALKIGIRMGNYTHGANLKNILLISVLSFFVLEIIFRYSFLVLNHNLYNIDFVEFLKMQFKGGFYIKGTNTGIVGLLISWAIQIGMTYFVGYFFFVQHLYKYAANRTPEEVIDFAYYHLNKGKSESEVRQELSDYGWTSKQKQDEVFEALDAIFGIIEIQKNS